MLLSTKTRKNVGGSRTSFGLSYALRTQELGSGSSPVREHGCRSGDSADVACCAADGPPRAVLQCGDACCNVRMPALGSSRLEAGTVGLVSVIQGSHGGYLVILSINGVEQCPVPLSRLARAIPKWLPFAERRRICLEAEARAEVVDGVARDRKRADNRIRKQARPAQIQLTPVSASQSNARSSLSSRASQVNTPLSRRSFSSACV